MVLDVRIVVLSGGFPIGLRVPFISDGKLVYCECDSHRASVIVERKDIQDLQSENEELLRELQELRQSNKELLVCKQQLDAIMDNAPVEVYLKDRDGRYLRINK